MSLLKQKSHGQRNLESFTVHGVARVRHDLATKEQLKRKPPENWGFSENKAKNVPAFLSLLSNRDDSEHNKCAFTYKCVRKSGGEKELPSQNRLVRLGHVEYMIFDQS